MKLRAAVVIVVTLWSAYLAHGQDSAVSRRPDRVERLQQWIEAVEQHELGVGDDWLLRVASWDRATLWRVWVDAGTIVSLARDPDVLLFSAPNEVEPFSGFFRLPPTQRRFRAVSYDRDVLRRLQALARDVVSHGGEDRILKRGAALHSDIVMLGAGTLPGPDPARRPRTSSVMLFLSDGQQTGLDDATVHWEMGRRLLDRVRPKNSRKPGPDPGGDDTVRLWYLAANVYMQASEQMEAWQVERSVQLFPQDAEMLFIAACAREWFSGPQVQNTLQSATLSRDQFSLIGNEGAELRNAERLFRESLEREPGRSEARIRLGRVLGRRGRHQDAIVELRQASMETKNRLLLYYGSMFLGAEADALGLSEEARQAYERAAKLYPLAQSPRLALGALAARSGDRAQAAATVEPVLARDESQLADDPWWSYYTSQARDVEGVIKAMYDAIPKGSQ